jgi:hypothetical protein
MIDGFANRVIAIPSSNQMTAEAATILSKAVKHRQALCHTYVNAYRTTRTAVHNSVEHLTEA